MIQQSSALALGRLANYNDELAEAVVSNEFSACLLALEQNRFYKRLRRSCCVLSPSTRHSWRGSRPGALDAGGLPRGVRSWSKGVGRLGLGCRRHNGELAQTVVDAGAVPLLVLCIQEPK